MQPGNDGPTVTVSQVRITDPSQAVSSLLHAAAIAHRDVRPVLTHC